MRTITFIVMLFVSNNSFANNNVKIALEKFAWEKRQLVLFSPNENHREYKEFNRLSKLNKFEIDDRNLQTWHVIKNDKVRLDSKFINSFSNKDIREAFKVKPNEFKIILIGYDQGEKLRLTYADLDYIFAKVDQMPMRIQEMQNNN